jgi:hypothetical protein
MGERESHSGHGGGYDRRSEEDERRLIGMRCLELCSQLEAMLRERGADGTGLGELMRSLRLPYELRERLRVIVRVRNRLTHEAFRAPYSVAELEGTEAACAWAIEQLGGMAATGGRGGSSASARSHDDGGFRSYPRQPRLSPAFAAFLVMAAVFALGFGLCSVRSRPGLSDVADRAADVVKRTARPKPADEHSRSAWSSHPLRPADLHTTRARKPARAKAPSAAHDPWQDVLHTVGDGEPVAPNEPAAPNEEKTKKQEKQDQPASEPGDDDVDSVLRH